jgi:predicted secreted protein
MNRKIRTPSLAAALALALAAGGARAAGPEPQNVTMNTTRDGADAASVQAALKQALEAALAEAKKSAQPGLLDVRTGHFSLFPRYGDKGRITGWQGTAELVLEGKDLPRVTQTAGRITTLTVAQVAQSLSREARERHEGEATAQAIAAYREKAQAYAKQFGFSGYTLREIHVATNEPSGYAPVAMRAKVAMAEAAPLPVEAGIGLVTATVSGSVVMTR